MKIAVIGAGGVGGYFGARLAKAGHDVQFLVRGAHGQAMGERGLRIQSEVESFTLERPRITGTPGDLAGAEVMLVTTKLWDLEATARQVAPAVGPQAVVVPFQNGVDAIDMLATSIPRERIAAGTAYISAVIDSPGVIAHTGTFARLRVGALHPSQRESLVAFAAAGEKAGFAAEFVQEPQRMLWEKFILLNTLSGMTALTRQTIGVIRTDPHLRDVFRAVFREGMELAAASGVPMAPDFAERNEAVLDALPESMRASMAHDLLAGRRLEAPWLCGAVVRRAAAAGVPVPVNATVWAALKPFVDGAAG